MSIKAMARDMSLEVQRAELHALVSAMLDAFSATLSAPDLSADEVGAGLRDVVSVFSGELERRIPGWTDVDPQRTVPAEEKPMELSEQDKKAIELSKMVRGNPELKAKVRKADDARAAKDPIEKQHPISKAAAESKALAEYEPELLEIMSKERVSFEVAVGKLARDGAYHDLKRRYKEEMMQRGAS
jgi:hypothetical protein